MISQKTLKIAMGVSMVLCASASFAGVEEGFEGALDSKWSGDTTDALVSMDPNYTKDVGYPILSGTHAKVLNVEGEVICANTATKYATSVSDFLVYIPELSDELETAGLDNAKIAVAAGTELSNNKIPLMLYCKKADSDTATWTQIAEVDSNTWYRVTLVFKGSRCRVSLDGEPVKSTHGYATYNGSDANGAWYNLALASVPSDLSIGSLSFIGSAKLDDVVIKDEFLPEVFGDKTATIAGSSDGVKYDDLNKLGVTSAEVAENLNTINYLGIVTGMSVKERLECGYSLATETKFAPVSITKTEANQATIKFPIESTSELNRYSVVLEGGKADGNTTVTGATLSETGMASITLSNLTYDEGSNVIKFILKAEKPASGN